MCCLTSCLWPLILVANDAVTQRLMELLHWKMIHSFTEEASIHVRDNPAAHVNDEGQLVANSGLQETSC